MNGFAIFWFIMIAILWTGFFVLEGFDFGVGMLHSVVGRDEAGRRAAINTIGPLWDGNEVWLIVAGAAMFAAFPGWYATMFSGFYLALVLLLAALIVRGVSFEYRGKGNSPRWRRTWSWLLTIGSLLAPLLIGVALGDLLHGLPVNANHQYTGSFWTLLQPYGIYVGITLVAVCAVHGATFLSLKTEGPVRERSRRLARRAAPPTTLLVLGFVAWTHAIAGKGTLLNPIELIVVIAIIASAWLAADHREGWAFAATTATVALIVVTLFVDLYPRLMVSSINHAYDLTINNSASPRYSLTAMTIVSAILLPFVIAYTAWNYYVFRRRVSDKPFRAAPPAPREPEMAPAQAAGTAAHPRPVPAAPADPAPADPAPADPAPADDAPADETPRRSRRLGRGGRGKHA